MCHTDCVRLTVSGNNFLGCLSLLWDFILKFKHFLMNYPNIKFLDYFPLCFIYNFRNIITFI